MAEEKKDTNATAEDRSRSFEDARKKAGNLGQDTLLMVTFTLAGQTYGGDILQIQEVSGLSHITRVPHVRDFIRGVTNLRGNIVPTIDLSRRLGLKPRKEGETDKLQIMIARTEQGLIGYIVDAVREVIAVPRKTIEPTPDDWLDADHQYFAGIAKLEDHLVTLVDFSKMVQIDQVMLNDAKTG